MEARARLARLGAHELPETPDGLRGNVLVEAEDDHGDLGVDVARVERQRALGDQARLRARGELQRVGVGELRGLRARLRDGLARSCGSAGDGCELTQSGSPLR